ncbi:MAG: DUF2179 domain-containing protein [Sphingobacteriales bacterium]|jgi:uncharacterized protein YebE (UPF0316 family)|nr:DUF2179 domain-containing protein [Sphingobacteriales bacterium]
MFSDSFMQSEMFQWVVLPLLVFFARMCDVTLATLRNIFLSKSVRYIVPFLGFIEVLIWLLAISQIMRNLNNPVCFITYALGYSTGIFFGIKIEERLALGLQVMRIITQQDAGDLRKSLVEHSFGITTIDAEGAKGPVKILLTVIKRKDVDLVRSLVHQHQPNAFYSVEDIRTVSKGVFPQSEGDRMSQLRRMFPFGGGK